MKYSQARNEKLYWDSMKYPQARNEKWQWDSMKYLVNIQQEGMKSHTGAV